ncbi:DUF1853 family protein [Halomonas sp. HL-93]|uniref:DUF1853 family protein n=1 Tax=Halomonas sp. HL-93 TaxID=1666906 RepID=UPI0006D94F46|nr:DUF1853 family protein [Halomonas sp. HL-93]KPQ19654.1 MAG: hypothetical protein HLUCCO06_01280 [Halomonas sp. HL-93]SBR51975.1 hypothetical protein GA0071314_3459 [Halomonas sp. HL-93]
MQAIKPQQLEGVTSSRQGAILRDLAWLAVTPDVVELAPPFPHAGRPSLAELGLSDSLETWLDGLAIPDLARNGRQTSRMGHYHEQLWHWLLDRAPNTRLLARNVSITRQRITLGELDMLYRRCNHPAPVHLEVAIKFYLGLPEGPGEETSQSRWIGPGGLDSLALKCGHLQRHQLPLSTTLAGLGTLNHWLAPRDIGSSASLLASQLTQRLAMPGVLFYPWNASMPPPEGATATHRRGRWCHVGDWPAFAATLPVSFLVAWLEKPHWLAPPAFDTFTPASVSLRPLLAMAEYRPQQIMLYMPLEQRTERLFIVPDNWPRQIPLPPTGR